LSNLLPVMVHETVLQHGIEVMHSPMVTDAVSFISAAPAMRALRETGHSIAHWLGDHFQPQLGDSGAKALPTADAEVKAPLVQERADDSEAWGGGRMVEFFAQSCPHCKHLEPIWKDASHKWAEQGQDSVRWEQKECYGENWAEGKDHDECMKEGIHSFPTVRFFSKSGKKFADFSDERTPENLVGFAARHGAKPERIAPLEETREEHSLGLTDPSSPVKVVEYVAKSCPHCQSMEPIWNDLKAATASKKNILWEQKECFGKGWAPGKDLEECKKADIQGFPTIKFFGPQGGPGEEFSGARSVSSILKWVEQHTQPAPEVLQEVAAKTVQAAAGPLWAAALCTPVLDRRSKADFL